MTSYLYLWLRLWWLWRYFVLPYTSILTFNQCYLQEPSVTAAHCSRTLILASISGNPQLNQFSNPLLSGFVQSLIKLSSYQDDSIMPFLPIIQEAWKCFQVLFTISSEQNSMRFPNFLLTFILTGFLETQTLAFILPIMTLYLQPHTKSLTSIHQQTLTQILSFASASPNTFKEVTSELEASSKDILEFSVKQALSGVKVAGVETTKPQISLRAF